MRETGRALFKAAGINVRSLTQEEADKLPISIVFVTRSSTSNEDTPDEFQQYLHEKNERSLKELFPESSGRGKEDR